MMDSTFLGFRRASILGRVLVAGGADHFLRRYSGSIVPPSTLPLAPCFFIDIFPSLGGVSELCL